MPDPDSYTPYYYDGRFAIQKRYGDYIFVTPDGQFVEKLGKWEKLEQFDSEGLAKASKSGRHYLLDTLGRLYQVAYSLENLSPQTTALDISHLDWEGFPEQILAHPQLEILLLDGKYPKERKLEIPADIGKLSKLKVLSATYTTLHHLPIEIGQLSELEKLDLSWTSIHKLPKEIGQLKKLRWLRIFTSPLNHLPREIGTLSSLEKLELGSTHIAHLPKEIGQLKQLKWLDISQSSWDEAKLKRLPIEIGQLESLEWLDISFTKINHLPLEIGQLKRLKELHLNPRIRTFPQEFAQLQNLEWLFIRDSKLSKIPGEIKQLKNLKGLIITGTTLSLSETDALYKALPDCKVLF